MSTTCSSQVVPSAYPDLHDLDTRTATTTDRQLNDLLDGIVSELFPPGTDPFDVYAYGAIYQPALMEQQQQQQQAPSYEASGQLLPGGPPSAAAAATKTHPHFLHHHHYHQRHDADWATGGGGGGHSGGIVESNRFNYAHAHSQSIANQAFPKDPRRWSVDHVQTWIQSAAFEQRLGSIDPAAFSMNGDQLSRLTRDEFKMRAPLAGDILFSLYASLVKGGADPQQRRIGSKCVHPTWYPKEIAIPSSSATPVVTNASGIKESSDTFSDCSSSTSCCYDDKGGHHSQRLSVVHPPPPPSLPSSSSASVASSMSGFSSYNQGINYTPLTGISQSLPLCEPVYGASLPSISLSAAAVAAASNPYSVMNINPFPQRKYRPPIPKDALPTHLRTFLKELLSNKMYSYCIEWADESKGIFRILNSEEVARFWGIRKNRPKMNYDKLSRSLRFYYKKRLLKKVPGQRLVYQFTEPDDYDDKEKEAILPAAAAAAAAKMKKVKEANDDDASSN